MLVSYWCSLYDQYKHRWHLHSCCFLYVSWIKSRYGLSTHKRHSLSAELNIFIGNAMRCHALCDRPSRLYHNKTTWIKKSIQQHVWNALKIARSLCKNIISFSAFQQSLNASRDFPSIYHLYLSIKSSWKPLYFFFMHIFYKYLTNWRPQCKTGKL